MNELDRFAFVFGITFFLLMIVWLKKYGSSNGRMWVYTEEYTNLLSTIESLQKQNSEYKQRIKEMSYTLPTKEQTLIPVNRVPKANGQYYTTVINGELWGMLSQDYAHYNAGHILVERLTATRTRKGGWSTPEKSLLWLEKDSDVLRTEWYSKDGNTAKIDKIIDLSNMPMNKSPLWRKMDNTTPTTEIYEDTENYSASSVQPILIK